MYEEGQNIMKIFEEQIFFFSRLNYPENPLSFSQRLHFCNCKKWIFSKCNSVDSNLDAISELFPDMYCEEIQRIEKNS